MPSKKNITVVAVLVSICSTFLIHIRLSVLKTKARELIKVVDAPIPTTPPITNTCPSLFKQQNKDNEHLPLVFERHNLVVCRTPKVGSIELRGVANSYHQNASFVPLTLNSAYTDDHTLSDISIEHEFNHYLYGNDVTRILFVRHPVYRILTGFLEVARFRTIWTKVHDMKSTRGSLPRSFHVWITSGAFRRHYHSS